MVFVQFQDSGLLISKSYKRSVKPKKVLQNALEWEKEDLKTDIVFNRGSQTLFFKGHSHQF